MVVLGLILAASLSRPYPVLKAKDFAVFQSAHACIVATVEYINIEKDGDIHIRLVDETGFVVGEIIPRLALTVPPLKIKARFCGIVRYDKKHKWYELHPLEYIEKDEQRRRKITPADWAG